MTIPVGRFAALLAGRPTEFAARLGWSLVIPLRATALIEAPAPTVARVLHRSDVWTRTARAMGRRAVVDGAGDPFAPLRGGDLIRVAAGRGTRELTFRVAPDPVENDGAATDSRLIGPVLEIVDGYRGSGRVRVSVAPTPAGSLTTVDAQLDPSRRVISTATWPALRRRVLRAERILLGIAALAADEVTVVVAAAVVHDGRVLAARRTRPAELAGRWELPGGKAHPGEPDGDALVRELREELGIEVEVGGRIGPDIELGPRTLLRCLAVTLPPGSSPASVEVIEHDELRWLAPHELAGVDWLDADRALLPALGALLDR